MSSSFVFLLLRLHGLCWLGLSAPRLRNRVRTADQRLSFCWNKTLSPHTINVLKLFFCFLQFLLPNTFGYAYNTETYNSSTLINTSSYISELMRLA